jgi:hypothetical protein
LGEGGAAARAAEAVLTLLERSEAEEAKRSGARPSGAVEGLEERP